MVYATSGLGEMDITPDVRTPMKLLKLESSDSLVSASNVGNDENDDTTPLDNK